MFTEGVSSIGTALMLKMHYNAIKNKRASTTDHFDMPEIS